MKKNISLILLSLYFSNIFAQFTASSSTQFIQITTEQNIDAIFLFNGINSATEIRYNGTETFEWRKFDNSFVANTANFSPDDGTGYIVFDKTNNTPLKYIWVIDYSAYPIKYNALTPNGNCDNLTVSTDFNVSELVFYDKNNTRKTLPRIFTYEYTDYTYKDSVWQDKNVSENKTYPFDVISVDAPKKDINFCIKGDNYARDMGIITQPICIDYKAIAVESHLDGAIEKRSGTNEYKRDDSKERLLSGSAPLVIFFKSNANTPVASYFEWKIFNTQNPNAYHRYNEENIHYSFYETGNYMAKLEVKNRDGSCLTEDSIRITVLESLLDVPNAFSPNGDGINDEFRVVFKSLKSYKIVVFNRWGRVVYQGTDPSKGWDGRIGGKTAAEGTYYYIIEALGTDKYSSGKNKGKNIIHNKKGHINLFK